MTTETRLASLPMYCEAEVRSVTERWWSGLARHLRDRGVSGVPDTLTWPDDYHGHWRSPALLFSQTCGYPFVNVLGPAVKLVATPRYDVPGCKGPRYGAHVIVRETAPARSVADLRGCRLATNGTGSYSGYHVWRHMLPAGDRPTVLLRRNHCNRRPPRQSPLRRGGRRGRVRGRLRHPRIAL